MQKYSVNQHLTETILAWVKSKEVAIPEIQRPFVWDATKVRDLMDSLYKGYPIGYLIVWRNPNVRSKDGKVAEGRKILIDGQQRIIAMKAAILGDNVIDKEYESIRITIAFNPLEERFEVCNPAIERDVTWIPDISKIISGDINILDLIRQYCSQNKDISEDAFYKKIEALKHITKKQIGVIELEHDLDIETVTDIFIRINSQGVMLSQADFAMSKIAANEKYNGMVLRKCIDYFCHLAIAPEFYPTLKETDKEFVKTDYFKQISWLKDEIDDLYDPDYSDLLRVVFCAEFERGRMSDLVSLLTGRNFETRTYEEEIAENAFTVLSNGVSKFVNETNFKRFLIIIKSAGFITSNLIRSQNSLNFAYTIYLKLRSMNVESAIIEKYVRKWFVLSVLTGRYSASPESRFDTDIKNISNKDFQEYLQNIEKGELSSAFWENALPQSMITSVASSPYFHLYLASQVKANDKGFLSSDITIQDLILHRGDIHHVFPRGYLKKHGLKRRDYNQIANYVYMQSEINIKLANKSPKEYMQKIRKSLQDPKPTLSGIETLDDLNKNLQDSCIPQNIHEMEINDYEEFLQQRRLLIAQKLKDYYRAL